VRYNDDKHKEQEMITSINIQTANHSIIEAIRAITALDPETTITYDNEDYLSQADQQDLKRLVESDKHGELKYQSFDDFKTEMRSYLKTKGA